MTATLRADEVTSRGVAELMQKGNEALAAGKYQDALAAYDEAKKSNPESPEVAYNRGIALYRLGQYDAAQRALQDALKPDRPDMEARVKYNLGRSAHEAAIAGRDKPEEAINSIGKAINFYKEAQTLNAKDDDPRKNLEQAERLRAFFEKKLKEKQEEKNENPSSQPKDEPTSQPDEKQQPSSQPSSQPNEQKGEQGEEGDEQQQDQKGEDQKQQKGDKDKKNKGDQQGQSEPQDGEKKEGEESPSEEQQVEQAKQEEVEPMLQEARDAEKARREAKRAKMMRLRGKIPVSKDW